MNKLYSIIDELKDVARNPGASVMKVMKDTGKKAVGCFPIYAPEEIVYAAGALPVGMWGGPTVGTLSNKYLQTFCCSVMKANTEQALSDQYDCLSAVIMTTYCDTLKCVLENWKIASPQLNIIPMVYPQNRKIEAGRLFLREELIRIKHELEKVLDTEISYNDISYSVDLYDNYRKTMQEFTRMSGNYPDLFDAVTRHLLIKAAYFMDKQKYTEKMKDILMEVKHLETSKSEGKRIILTGLLAEPDEFLALFSENDMIIVADDLAQESRQFRVSSSENGDAFDKMVDRISRQDGCSFLYDESKTRGQMLINMKEEYRADAIVVCQMKFCDPEEFDYPIIKKELNRAGIPILHVEIEQQMDSVEQLRTRIQGFAEIL